MLLTWHVPILLDAIRHTSSWTTSVGPDHSVELVNVDTRFHAQMSASSELLLRATMRKKSSLSQVSRFVSKALLPDTVLSGPYHRPAGPTRFTDTHASLVGRGHTDARL